MRINAVQLQVRQAAHRQNLFRGLRGGHAEPSHAGVHGHSAGRGFPLPDRFGADLLRHFKVVQRADDAVLHRRGDLVRQQVAENLHRQPERNQLDRLIDLRHAERGGSRLLHHLRHRLHAEAVGVRLQHRHQPAGGNPPPDFMEIIRQFFQVDFKVDPTFQIHLSHQIPLKSHYEYGGKPEPPPRASRRSYSSPQITSRIPPNGFRESPYT